jgi:hypothetical protein
MKLSQRGIDAMPGLSFTNVFPGKVKTRKKGYPALMRPRFYTGGSPPAEREHMVLQGHAFAYVTAFIITAGIHKFHILRCHYFLPFKPPYYSGRADYCKAPLNAMHGTIPYTDLSYATAL